MAMAPKRPRLRLEPEAYQRLTRQVLQRDGWRCQRCGTRRHLQAHHLTHPSQQGEDAETNLITLCSQCHGAAHGR